MCVNSDASWSHCDSHPIRNFMQIARAQVPVPTQQLWVLVGAHDAFTCYSRCTRSLSSEPLAQCDLQIPVAWQMDKLLYVSSTNRLHQHQQQRQQASSEVHKQVAAQMPKLRDSQPTAGLHGRIMSGYAANAHACQ